MSRRVVLACDWRGCGRTTTLEREDVFPEGWAEFTIALRTSGPLPEWMGIGYGQNTRVIVVCPEHVGGMFGGVPGQPPTDAPRLGRGRRRG